MARLRNPPKPQKPSPDEVEVKSGLYFEDGKRLLRVVEVVDRSVMLEDCRRPDGLPEFMEVSDMQERAREHRLRLVRPAGET